MNILTKAKNYIAAATEKKYLTTIKEFGHANKNLLIIVCDPASDRIFVTYKDRFVNGKIKSVEGKSSKVVKNVLKYSRFNENIDGYLTSIMETLALPIWRANQFFQFLDGALYNIAKSLRKKRSGNAVPSPYSEKK